MTRQKYETKPARRASRPQAVRKITANPLGRVVQCASTRLSRPSVLDKHVPVLDGHLPVLDEHRVSWMSTWLSVGAGAGAGTGAGADDGVGAGSFSCQAPRATQTGMVTARPLPPPARSDPPPGDIDYPDSDGEPMSDNTLQFSWIMLLKENLDALLPDFVAGDLLWYPVEGSPTTRIGPDVLVALGRPKGYRGSYMQWREAGIAPQVVVEILSPNNTLREMMRKAAFYNQFGVQEFITIDPDARTGWAQVRTEQGPFDEVASIDGWTSPLLGIRFVREGEELAVYAPHGARFMSFAEEQAERLQATARAERESERAERESERARRMADRLAALGVDPDSV